ncbi:fucose-specific lectin [Hypoxylon rubiginosum]|uniref:Fucose-specific lectin n=1 Tax=Hypoxylon rubiginosum TaxID=110542 RepID=A0ACB9ZA50_9PEZI|nr:fucose-specific lectin [Hypoxylon rubiginosum]
MHRPSVVRCGAADLSESQAVLVGEGTNSPHQKRTAKKLLLITLAGTVIVIGVVVGAVVGTRASRSSPPPRKANSKPIYTSNPTSKWPGLSPTAVSWDFLHLEIFAAPSESEFIPEGNDMELVGGSLNAESVPSVAINQQQAPCISNKTKFSVTGAPAFVQYKLLIKVVQGFYLGPGDTGLTTYYSKWTSQSNNLWSANNHLLHASYNSTANIWSAYEDLQGVFTTSIHLSYDNSNKNWTDWTCISGDMKIQGQPDAISATSDTIDVFAWGDDGSLLHKSFNSMLADTSEGQFTGPSKAVGDGPCSIHVFAYRNQNELVWMSLNNGSVGQTADTRILADVPYI